MLFLVSLSDVPTHIRRTFVITILAARHRTFLGTFVGPNCCHFGSTPLEDYTEYLRKYSVSFSVEMGVVAEATPCCYGRKDWMDRHTTPGGRQCRCPATFDMKPFSLSKPKISALRGVPLRFVLWRRKLAEEKLMVAMEGGC